MTIFNTTTSIANDDPLANWRKGVRLEPVAPDAQRHSIHAYFNTCPESPDGRHVLYYTSATDTGEEGDIRILERATGKETIIATNIHTEDAHRAACQQWVNGGKTIVYHDCVDGHWRVMKFDLATGKQTLLALDRQLGFGSQLKAWAPIYGCHWNPGEHRDLELVDVETTQITKPVTVAQVIEKFGPWVQKRFESNDLSIFFPVMSPDGNKVFFKIARPTYNEDFHAMNASLRDGKVVFDLSTGQFIRLFEKWGHPSWNPASNAILENDKKLHDLATGTFVHFAPTAPSNHPNLSPDSRIYATDADVSKRDFGKPGDWAVMVGDTREDQFVVVAQFNNTAGATSWRRVHPHPTFSADGKRIYYNVSDGPWSRLFVAHSSTK